ncbi:MAG: hypothetical protein HS111_25455 [Kofleriaceae bacterium]|nr:hypothetical protein [Kofleriaceae bacterium]MCL4223668.1 hypothetical protein [Myxococcales bacterium]
MPSSAEILAGLAAIANQGLWIAFAWHLILGTALYALTRGWCPSRRLAGVLIAPLLVSVSAFAFAFGNPFNGAVFAGGAAALVALALVADERPVRHGPRWSWWGGLAMLAFGWVYPHFLSAHPITYLYAAPVGLVPCPTLSIAIGLALLSGGLGSRAWTLTLAGLGLFYGLFGVLRLGVLLDLGLVAGATILAVVAVHPGRATTPVAHPAHPAS